MPGNIQAIPLSVIDAWPKPDYLDPVRRTWLTPYAAVLQGLTTILVGTRLYLRARNQAGPFGLDDALLIPGFLSATVFTTLTILATERYGVDRHIWDVSFDKIEGLALVAWLSEVMFLVSTSCTKISVLLFFRRLTQGISKLWRAAIFAAIAFTFCYAVGFVLALCLTCTPTMSYWKAFDPTYTHDYHCVDTRVLNTVSGVFSVVSDLYSVLLPLFMVRHLNVDAPRRQKIALNLIFSLGLLIVAAGSVRTYYTYLLGVTYDPSWVGFNLYIWSDLEMQLSIICASAPVMRVFFRKYLSNSMSRMLHSARTISNNGTRGSHPIDPEAMAAYSENQQSPSHDSQLDDKELIKHQFRSGMEPVGEDECSSPSTVGVSDNPIRTAADFEAFALRNLEKHRPPPRISVSRPISEEKQPMSQFREWTPQSKF